LGCSGGDFGMGLAGDRHHGGVGWLVKMRWLWQWLGLLLLLF